MTKILKLFQIYVIFSVNKGDKSYMLAIFTVLGG